MRAPRSDAARRAVGRYRGLPVGDRFQVRVRWWTCPMEAVEAAVPRQGRVLDLGCGHGLLSWYLAATGPERTVVGVDIDPHKIDLARRTVVAGEGEPGGPAVEFAVVAPGDFAPGPWDAIGVADVLYLLPAPARQALLERCSAELAPGGVLVVKEVDRHPAWKYRLALAQELVSTRVLRITAGEDVDFAEPAELVAQLQALGLSASCRRVDRGYPHPHVLITAARPGA
jgi:2-polyprenyl-3-methyl-5-hydroxy-6-metoxy-1,4-benzoquinol methylase